MKKRKNISYIISCLFIVAGMSTTMDVNTRQMGLSWLLTGVEIILGIFVYERMKREKRNILIEIVLLTLMASPILLTSTKFFGEQPIFVVPFVIIIGIYLTKWINKYYKLNLLLKIVLYILIWLGIVSIKMSMFWMVMSIQSIGKDATSINVSQDELFQKNEECAKYKDKIQEEIKKEHASIGNRRLESLFYSPIKNSCIYTVMSTSYPYTSKYIKDYFTNEQLGGNSRITPESCDASSTGDEVLKCKQDNKNKQQEIEQTIRKLKGE